HVVEVLRGSLAKNIVDRCHDKLSTHGLLRDLAPGELKDFIHQLIGQSLLAQSEGDYPLLKLTPGSWEVMRGQKPAKLMRLKGPEARKTKVETARPAGVDDGLFERLRALRRELAQNMNVPPYVVFTDHVLVAFGRRRP